MKKSFLILMSVMIAGATLAETDYIANKRIDNIRKGTQNAKDRINDLYVAGTVTVPDGSIDAAALSGSIDSTQLVDAWSNSYMIITGTIATNANGGTNVVTFAAKHPNGDAITGGNFAIRFFITDTVDGALAAVAGDVVVTTGMELQQVVDKADYWIASTNNTGSATVTITDDPGGTNYVHWLDPNGMLRRVTSAFNIP